MELVNNNTDLRVIKTHLAIEKAFFKLLEQEPYANITILRIVDEAMIGQTTFYHHYQDKTDLATRLIHAVLDKLSAFFQQPGNNSTLTEITIPQQAEYIELLHRVRLLRQINTPELSFEVCAVNYITKQIHCDLNRYELNLHYPKEVSAHLSALFYSLFMTLVDHHDDYDVSNLEVQFYESIKALTTLIAPPPPENEASTTYPAESHQFDLATTENFLTSQFVGLNLRYFIARGARSHIIVSLFFSSQNRVNPSLQTIRTLS